MQVQLQDRDEKLQHLEKLQHFTGQSFPITFFNAPFAENFSRDSGNAGLDFKLKFLGQK